MNKTIIAIVACAALYSVVAIHPASAAESAAPESQSQDPIMQIDNILTRAGVFFLATVDGDQPKLRPLGSHHVVDGRIWFGVGEFKNVYRQLAENPKCELVALIPGEGKWLRWIGRADFAEGADRERLEEVFLDAVPDLRAIYDKEPGHRMMCFTLFGSRAELVSMMPPGEIILDETAGPAK